MYKYNLTNYIIYIKNEYLLKNFNFFIQLYETSNKNNINL